MTSELKPKLQRKQHFAGVLEHLKYALSLSNPQLLEFCLSSDEVLLYQLVGIELGLQYTT